MVETLARRTALLIQARKQIQELNAELSRKNDYLNLVLDANLTLAKRIQKLEYALDSVCERALSGLD